MEGRDEGPSKKRWRLQKPALYSCNFIVCLQLGEVKKQLCPEVLRPQGLQVLFLLQFTGEENVKQLT